MPFIIARVNTHIDKNQELAIKSEMGRAITLIPGKNEKYLMLGLEDDYKFYLRGDSQKAALIEASIFGNEDHEGIAKYNNRLAKIYMSEINIGGLPMNMENFNLFDENHRSSYPLNIAYKAAELINPDKVYLYLLRLRRATILEGRQTTLDDELINIAREVGINEKIFCEYYYNGQAMRAFQEDLNFKNSLGIHYLPSCIIQCGNQAKIVNGLIGFDNFLAVIENLRYESSKAPVYKL